MQNTPREWKLLQQIKNKVQRQHSNTIVGIGDDAFVFKNFPGNSVICQDMMIEGTHFDRAYFGAADLGHKALAVNLSDMAAMGARPHFVQVSLGFPENLNESWLDQFYQGMCDLADRHGCEIVGGDLCKSPLLMIDVSVVGSTENPLRRAGTQANDVLLASGSLGLSHVGYWALKNQKSGFHQSKQKHLRPAPRLDLLNELQDKHSYISAVMDCSDGLINDALQLSGGLGLVIEEIELQHSEIVSMADEEKISPSEIYLWGGEDYELLISVPQKHLHHFPSWKRLGVWQKEPDFYLRTASGKIKIESFEGWAHF